MTGMKPLRGKAIALTAGLLGTTVVIASGFAFKGQIQERYWLWKVQGGDEAESAIAAEKLAQMRSQSAVPILIRLVQRECSSPRNRDLGPYYFSSALAKMEVSAVPALIKTLGDKDQKLREEAASILGQIGNNAKDAVPALIDLLRDQDYRIRVIAASALRGIDPTNNSVVSAMIERINDEAFLVRMCAVIALGRVGDGDARAIPAVIAALEDRAQGIRCLAASTLAQMGPKAQTATSALVAVQDDEDEAVRSAVSDALRQIRGE